MQCLESIGMIPWWIRLLSYSANNKTCFNWVSPMVLQEKKQKGEIRICVDLSVITHIFLEVVRRGKGSKVTTNQLLGTKSSQFVPREGSLFKVQLCFIRFQASYESFGILVEFSGEIQQQMGITEYSGHWANGVRRRQLNWIWFFPKGWLHRARQLNREQMIT